jgi:HEAT repeat protein
MPSPPKWDTTPRRSVAAQCERIGTPAVVAGCVALLDGRRTDPTLILALGGRPARWAAGYDEPAAPAYWLRVWGARGLLWAWDDKAANAVIHALRDESWRVREMAARVVGRHRLRPARAALQRLRTDENARVRHAAERALEHLA